MCEITKEEIWKDIEGYEGYYQVSNLGRVKSLERDVFYKDGRFARHKSETIKAPKVTKDGYLSVTLSVNCNDKTFAIHILVANAFVEKPQLNCELEVNHKDLDRKNNCASNLEWITHAENVSYSSKQGRYKKSHNGGKNGRSVPIRVTSEKLGIIKNFDCKMDFAAWVKKFFNLPYSQSGIFSGISKSIIMGRPYRSFSIELI